MIPGVGKIPWRRKWQPTPVFLPGISHGQRSLAGYSPWGCKESDMTEHLMWSVEIMKNENEREDLSVMPYSLQSHGLYSPWNSPGQNTGVSSLSLPQGIFPTQGSNPGLLHCRKILYQLSHRGSPRILEWVANLFSRGYSQPRNEEGSPALQVDSLPTELSGKPQ